MGLLCIVVVAAASGRLPRSPNPAPTSSPTTPGPAAAPAAPAPAPRPRPRHPRLLHTVVHLHVLS